MAGAVGAVYFFPGPESGRKRERINAISSALKHQFSCDLDIHRFYPYDTDVAQIISILRNGSLFATIRLVIVADAHALKNDGIKAFRDYISQPCEEACLIFTTDLSPGSRDYPRLLADSIPKGKVEIFWEMFERDKRGWVMKLFREHGFSADKTAVDLLLDVTEGTTDALCNACEQLIFSLSDKGTKKITEDDVDKVLEHSRAETAYTLFNRFCMGDLRGTLEAYRAIVLSNPSAAVRVPFMLAEPLQKLRDFSLLTGEGLSAEEAARQLKIRGGKRAMKAYISGSQKMSNSRLDQAVSSLINMESLLRGVPFELGEKKMEIWFCHHLGKQYPAS